MFLSFALVIENNKSVSIVLTFIFVLVQSICIIEMKTVKYPCLKQIKQYLSMSIYSHSAACVSNSFVFVNLEVLISISIQLVHSDQ